MLKIIVGVAFLLSLLMWFAVQYDFAGATFYMFRVKGTYLAFGYIEGYQGFLPFGFPPLFAFIACILSIVAIIIKSQKYKVYIYTTTSILAVSSIIVYVATFFNILYRYGKTLWTIFFWGSFALYFVALATSIYFIVNYFINKRKSTSNQN